MFPMWSYPLPYWDQRKLAFAASTTTRSCGLAAKVSLQKRLDQLAVASEPPAWHNAWKEVEGGLLTAVAAEAEYKGPPEDVDETDKLTRAVLCQDSSESDRSGLATE